eukprot:TRINITY_DN3201_c0_g1_i2.p1 TRINITY_DN3201_c0_g1~~TRINITY_DN3201_c0_g1_i2.p1  ORF type:complete len:341 (-),score=55.57 TRINITY_DN3201_c0_g1_i2:82-1104(-)
MLFFVLFVFLFLSVFLVSPPFLFSAFSTLLGDAGKTTFAKQLTMQYMNPTYQEKYANIARTNLLYVYKEIILYLRNLDFDFPTINLKDVHTVTNSCDLMSGDTVSACLNLRDVAFVKKVLTENGNNLDIPGGREGGEYFLQSLERISDPDFVPTKEDIIRSRTRTTGIHETNFNFNGKNMALVDVGGQRSERRKWLPSFSGVTSAVIYVVSTSDYNTMLEEDRKVNRLVDSVQLFHTLQSSPFLQGVPFMICLNKIDLFKRKLPESPISDYFPEYTESSDPDTNFKNGLEFISDLFRRNAVTEPNIFPTCALDAEECVQVFKTIFTHLMKNMLDDTGTLV